MCPERSSLVQRPNKQEKRKVAFFFPPSMQSTKKIMRFLRFIVRKGEEGWEEV